MAKTLREIVPLNELKKKTLGSYIKGAAKDMVMTAAGTQAVVQDIKGRKSSDYHPLEADADQKYQRRFHGVSGATMRLSSGKFPHATKKGYKWKPYQFEETINELKKETLSNYIHKAVMPEYPDERGIVTLGSNLTNKKMRKQRGDISRTLNKRMSGIFSATNRLTGQTKLGKKSYKFK